MSEATAVNELPPELRADFAALEGEAAVMDMTPTPAAAPDALPAEKSPADDWKEILHPLISVSFAVLCPNWNITPEESEVLSEAYAPVLGKYFPDAGTEFGPEIAAAFATAAIIAPRIGKPRRIEKEAPPEKRAPDPEREPDPEPTPPTGTPGEAQVMDLPEEIAA